MDKHKSVTGIANILPNVRFEVVSKPLDVNIVNTPLKLSIRTSHGSIISQTHYCSDSFWWLAYEINYRKFSHVIWCIYKGIENQTWSKNDALNTITSVTSIDFNGVDIYQIDWTWVTLQDAIYTLKRLQNTEIIVTALTQKILTVLKQKLVSASYTRYSTLRKDVGVGELNTYLFNLALSRLYDLGHIWKMFDYNNSEMYKLSKCGLKLLTTHAG